MIFGRFIDAVGAGAPSVASAPSVAAAGPAVDGEVARRPRQQMPPSAAAAGK
jgi:hypothetical protein